MAVQRFLQTNRGHLSRSAIRLIEPERDRRSTIHFELAGKPCAASADAADVDAFVGLSLDEMFNNLQRRYSK